MKIVNDQLMNAQNNSIKNKIKKVKPFLNAIKDLKNIFEESTNEKLSSIDLNIPIKSFHSPINGFSKFHSFKLGILGQEENRESSFKKLIVKSQKACKKKSKFRFMYLNKGLI